jgi:hypothetical protein
VRSRERNLFDQIERDALDDDVSLATTLRKVIALGGNVGSTKLREWANRELQGYVGAEEIPEYRRVSAAIMLDGRNTLYQMTGQQISRFDLPDFARDVVEERATLGYGVGELESIARKAREEGGVRLQIPGGPELTKIMNYQAAQQGIEFQTIERVYWSVSEPSVQGVLDTIRTTLVGLVAEMRAGMRESEETPSAAVADQAVNVAVHGDHNRIERIEVAQASGSGSHHAQAGPQESDGHGRLWLIAGTLATVVAAIVAVLTWQGWWS